MRRWMCPTFGLMCVVTVFVNRPPVSCSFATTLLWSRVCPEVGERIFTVAVECGRAPVDVLPFEHAPNTTTHTAAAAISLMGLLDLLLETGSKRLTASRRDSDGVE